MTGEPEQIRPALTFTDLLEYADSNSVVFRYSDEVIVRELEH